jgi:hypothetical protein
MSASPEPKPAAPAAPKTNPVWLAALAGGLLGGIFSLGLARAFPAQPKTPPPGEVQPSEARQFADEVIGKLKAGQNDEFIRYIRPAFSKMTDEQFAQVRQRIFEERTVATTAYGPSIAFEFCRETALSPTLVRLAYLEKYARGCLLWVMVVYNSPDGWRVVAFSLQTSESGFNALQ